MGEPLGATSSAVSNGDMNGHDSLTDLSFHGYPPHRPFLNSSYQRSPNRPTMSFPESNRDGVLSALRTLQEKMQRLELERRNAEPKRNTSESETNVHQYSSHQNSQVRDSDDWDQENPTSTGIGSSGFALPPRADVTTRDLEAQLSSAETRCQLLEKQLEYMRNMVHNADRDRSEAMHKAEILQHQHESSPHAPDYRAQLDRISELERDHLRLTATQTLAEAKIKELEKKLREERHHRHKLQEKAIDLESVAVSQRLLLDTAPEPEDKKENSLKKRVNVGGSAVSKKKKKKPLGKKALPPKSEPMKHYRLNLAEIPFVAGKSTTPSHAVGANVQKVLAMMKSHNLALCSSLYNGHNCGAEGEGRHRRSPSLSSTSSCISLDQDLADLLSQLQDELGQLGFEHQELMHQVSEALDPRIKEDLERELDSLVVRMEAKAQQISKVRLHQQKLEDAKRRLSKHEKRTFSTQSAPRPHSAMGRLSNNSKSPDRWGQHGSHSTAAKASQLQKTLGPPTLNVLKDMKKLQTTLRRDDLSWE